MPICKLQGPKGQGQIQDFLLFLGGGGHKTPWPVSVVSMDIYQFIVYTSFYSEFLNTNYYNFEYSKVANCLDHISIDDFIPHLHAYNVIF